MEIPKKTKNKTTIWPRNPTTGHIPWENHNWKGHMHPSVHSAPFTIDRTWQPKFPQTDEWKKGMVHMHNEILLRLKKERNWVICRGVAGPRVCHTEWGKSEREEQITYINPYTWNLEKNGANVPISRAGIRDADTENGHVVRVRKGWDELGNWDIHIHRHTDTQTHAHYHV